MKDRQLCTFQHENSTMINISAKKIQEEPFDKKGHRE